MRAHPTRGPTCCRAPRSFHRKADPPCKFHHTADPVSSHFGALPPCCLAAYAHRAHATRRAGRSEATARPSLRMEPKRVGPRAKSDGESLRTHRFRVPRAPGNRTRLLPTAFFVQLLRSIEYPGILRPCDLRFYRRNTRVYSTDSVSDTKNVMDTTLTPTPEGENRVGVRRLARREARERGATGEHAKGSDPETRNPRHVSLFSYKASSAQAAGTRRV